MTFEANEKISRYQGLGLIGSRPFLQREDMRHLYTIQSNISEAVRREPFQGEDHLVVPVVMIRTGVTMKGFQVPEPEIVPESWNGVPVTVGHPELAGEFISANAPGVLEQWEVGRIFNAEFVDGKLRAEAWINISRADPALIEELESGDAQMEVSSGYLAREKNGQHLDLKPDHLALLPNEVGACSWDDGCGVRANQRGRTMKMSINTALAVIASALSGSDPKIKTNAECQCQAEGQGAADDGHDAQANRRSSDDNRLQMVADLVSNDGSPFTAEDVMALEGMSQETLRVLRDEYLNGGDDKIKTGSNGDAGGDDGQEDDDGQVANQAADEPSEPKEEPAMADGKKEGRDQVMNADDRKALEYARKVHADHRASLVKKITANSDMAEEQVKDMETETLETVANGLKPAPDYSGRAIPSMRQNSEESDEDIVKGMTPPALSSMMAEKNQKEVH